MDRQEIHEKRKNSLIGWVQKTVHEREKELRLLVATPAGREELQELASRYHAASGKLRPAGTSVITYILVHERQQGLISA